jgi:hypothetical protein
MKRPTRRGPCHEISGVKDLNLPTTAACPARDGTYLQKDSKGGKGRISLARTWKNSYGYYSRYSTP